ncbi:ABC transporter permease [Mycetocola reblochoni]|uniref:Dipeptide transport system permease protein DppB (TC 3.A.1.5.2) n=2 Tax=Mycetocola reblochoni TaxID=331618 RepID=A0A1R4J165_9MICO|nr:ABC transporter permease [Mycetocola reblochoni]RLP71223.1 ABC transporter permease [Mycetocola reblochoni]SJN25911.1 Dipeptide transport system permease protein DppB (TC 3.A.1.5.2) [Mycetocola reblochoni REB411]
MLTFIARRIIAGVFLLFVISALSYVLLSLPGADVGRSLLGQSASAEAVAAKNQQLGLDRPVIVQYGDWLLHALRGDFGSSWFTSENVLTSISNRLPVTISVMAGVTIVTAVLSFLLGIWAAVRGGWIDRAVQIVSVVGYALPGFLITLILVIVFAVQLRWFPAIGYIDASVSLSGWLSTITLPIIALSIPAIAGVVQQVRGSVKDVLNRDYVRTLRARGLGPNRILFRHVMRNASAPALTVLGMQFVGLLGGAVIVEQIFGLPGIGSMTVSYTTRGDIPIIMGLIMFTVVGVILINLLIDVVIGWLNPKARIAS